MMLFYNPVGLAQALDLFQTRGSPPALETVYIRLHNGSNLFLSPVPPTNNDNIYQAIEKILEFKLSVQSINNRISVVLLESPTPKRAIACCKHTKVITIDAKEYLATDTSAIDISALNLQSDDNRYLDGPRFRLLTS